ncbi:sugar phosphate nucleotidyltransferase [Clostridium botulinum]|uniref:sugar phosphate nucleotidyltransferase n=1 Tax=Clostridium botulinum TaxID=1491 RepID=UPI0004D86DF5|nr:sugar phosphate nucleotidyltransferase [Clostridium botulinum]KEI01010.1 glucose-1-phosphate nucleotidyltransferase [Clostridium botulinum C/D str. BKT75002]KEI11176.1 glucose-1-phosphate nucleotidyltransferase [Clostridium botulinum C/D str. BKT2873]QPW61279.1 NTP transferase domain-containing protein [Clostridium botulinum]
MKAVIIAGGLGNRLRPLTCSIPKPMMPIADKPIIQYTIELLKRNDIKDIAITLQYMSDYIVNYLGDGKKFGVKITYFIEEMPLGTGGSVKNAHEFLNDTFIVISGDALIDIDLSEVIKYHKNRKSIATLVTKKVDLPLEYGVVITDNSGRIIKFLEKPSWSEVFSDKVNTGIYVLEPKVLSYYDENENFDFSKHLFPMLLENEEPMFVYTTKGYWCDIGNIEEYHNCNMDLLKGIINLKLNGKKYLQNIWVGKNSIISPKVKINPPVFIGENTKIYGSAEIGPYTILGNNNIIKSNVSIKKSITFDNCYIGDHSQIRGGILGKNVQIKDRTSIFENSVIGNNTIVESKVTINPAVKVWPNKLIDSGSILSSNYKWGEKYSKTIFGKKGVKGIINVDITPEFISKLASSAAQLLNDNKKIVIGCSENVVGEMLKHSLITGLLSMGVEVYDLNTTPNIVIRHAVVFFKADGAINITVDKDNPEKVTILFMNKNGIEIDKDMKRKIENNFNREDFRRVTGDEIKRIKYCDEILKEYVKNIIKRLNVDQIKKNNYNIILSCNNSIIINLIREIGLKIHVNIKIYNKLKHITKLKEEVLKESASMGIYIDDEGENAIIIDELGNVIKEENYKILKSFIMLKTCKFSTLAVPVNESKAMERIAYICGAKFIRTKISEDKVLEAYMNKEKDLSVDEIINEYLFTLDAIGTFIFILNLMAAYKVKISKINSILPKYYNYKKQIYCPWNKKGKVMRNLIEGNDFNVLEIIEGVSINYEEAWALILPDSDEPSCKIYIESKDKSKGKHIRHELDKKIQKILNENNYSEESS